MKGINNGLGGSSFSYDDSRGLLKRYLTRNIYAFSAAKSLTEMLEFRNLMYDKKTKKIVSYGEFKRRLTAKGKMFNNVYLPTEYETALQSAIMAHKWDSLKSEYLEFSTVGDDRVRPEHAALDGLTYPKNHPIWNKMYPPLSWNCRCTVVPGIASKYKPESAEEKGRYVNRLVRNTAFDTNVGKTRLVFTDQHPYMRTMENILNNRRGKELNFRNYGMKTIEQVNAVESYPEAVLLNDKVDYEAFWNAIMNNLNGAVFTDPLGQTVLFPDKQVSGNDYFKQHLLTRKGDADRWKLAANIREVIENPDEVWVTRKQEVGKKDDVSTQYVKYYNGNPLFVIVVGNEAKTMFMYGNKHFSGYKVRSGILLYRKTKKPIR